MPGVPCPHCGSSQSCVTDSRPNAASIRRRRRCLACNHLFTTREEIVGDQHDLRDERDRLQSRIKRMADLAQRITKLADGDDPPAPAIDD